MSRSRPLRRRPVPRLAPVAVVLAVLALASACGTDGSRSVALPDPDAAATATGAPVESPRATAPPPGPAPSPSRPAPTRGGGAPSSSAPVAPADSAPTAPVPAALRFSATTVGGRAFDAAQLAGRPVVLWFWAPWCSVCARQAPKVADLAEEYGDRVAFVGVGSLDKAAALKRFAARAPGPIHLDDEDGRLYRDFRISEQSSFVVLDADGAEVLRSGYDDDARLAAVVAEQAR